MKTLAKTSRKKNRQQKQSDPEREDILEGREVVWVRPWLVTMRYPGGKSMDAMGPDYKAIFRNVRDIWKQANIGIQVAPPMEQTANMSKELEEYKSKQALVTELNNELRPALNTLIGEDARRERDTIQAVFVPSYDRWGFTYHKGGDGYKGPVTFVTTHTASIGEELVSREQQSPPEYIDTAISLDTAHEIGHAFGLEHVRKQSEVQLLMHESLYHSFLNAEKQPDKEKAMEVAQKTFTQYNIPVIFKRCRKGGQFWAVMHGTELTEEQIRIVRENVTSRSPWQ